MTKKDKKEYIKQWMAYCKAIKAVTGDSKNHK